jgi:alcohol dehydrogenase class IV
VGRLRDVEQHVPVALAERAVAHSSRVDADVLVAIGGGSATGLAKAVALTTGLPVLAVPTTYAGSELTPIWGLTDGSVKTTGRDPRVLPRTVVYDPALTVSLPAGLTAASGMNALAHLVEALYAPDLAPETARVARAGVADLVAGLRGAVPHPDDLDARSRALRGASAAGLCLGATTMGLHHKLAHLLGGAYRLPHAGLHSALLPQVAAFNAAAAADALQPVAAAVAGEDTDGRYAGALLFGLATELGAPTSLRELGLPSDALDPMADAAAALAVANPAPLDRAALRRMLQAAFDGARPQ